MRTRGGGYWYAYGYRGQRKIKRYLGTTRKVTLPSLEEVAAGCINEQPTSVERSSVAPAAAPLPGALLLPKLSPPRLPAGLVMRERLLTHLDQALTYAFTLLSASAGSGKTTLLASWVRRVSSAVAWLALDDRIMTPCVFGCTSSRPCAPSSPRSAQTRWRNEYHTLRRWLKRLPAEVLYSWPELTFMFVSTIVLSLPHGPETLSQVEEPLSQAERGFRASLNQAGLAAVLTLRAVLMCF